MQSFIVSSFIGATVLIAAACGQNTDVSSLNAEPGSVVEDALASQVLGKYAIRANLATIQNLPFVGKTPALSSAYSILTIERDGQGLKAVERNCHITITSSGPVKQVIPDALPQSAAELQSPFRVWQDGDTLRIAKDIVPLVIGADVKGANEALPKAVNDVRVRDQDGDGKPGVTVKVSGLVTGDIYLVQRVKQSWSGSVTADGKLSALLNDFSEQSILDATSSLLKTAPEISKDPDTTKSSVNFVKLDSNYDCGLLIKAIPVLWPAI